MGVVYEAYDLKLHRHVALRFLPAGWYLILCFDRLIEPLGKGPTFGGKRKNGAPSGMK